MTTAFVRRRVHRYIVTETWGEPPEWLTDLVREPDAYFIAEYRGPSSTWEVADAAGQIVFGFAGDHAGISPFAVAQGVRHGLTKTQRCDQPHEDDAPCSTCGTGPIDAVQMTVNGDA